MGIEHLIHTALVTPMRGHPGDRLGVVWGLPLLLWGHPGIGKSDRVEEIAERLEMQMETVYAQTIEPTDISGISMPGPDGDFVQKTMIPQVRRLLEEQRGVLFLDEINGGTKAVQRALMGVVLARRVGDDLLPGGIRIIAAANPTESGADVDDIALPLANRMCHLQIDPPSPDEWNTWYLGQDKGGDFTLEGAEAKVTDGWSQEWSRTQGLVSAFIKRKGSDTLHKMPATGSDERQRGWASPRSWYAMGRGLTTARILYSGTSAIHDEIVNKISKGCVGEGASLEFLTWARDMDIPSPEELLQRPMKIDKRRLDRVLAAYNSLCAFLASVEKVEEKRTYAVPAWQRLQDLVQADLADIVVPAAKTLLRNGYGDRKLPKVPGLLDVQSKVAVVLVDSGLQSLL